jgi:DNA polymerase-3 subunit gamma/tau
VLTRIERLERRLDIATPAAAAPVTPSSPTAVASERPRGDVAPVVGRKDEVAPAPPVASERPRGDVAPVVGRNEGETEPAAASWPATAALGAESTQPATTPAAAPAASPTGALDAAALRHSWDAVLDAVKERKKTTHAQLLNARVLSLQGARLTLAFTHAPVMRQFQNGVSADVLKEALQASLGITLDIACVVHDSGAAEPATTQPPVTEGFAPGDEPAVEDPDATPPPDAGLTGEDAALRLVESELGGKVLGPAD